MSSVECIQISYWEDEGNTLPPYTLTFSFEHFRRRTRATRVNWTHESATVPASTINELLNTIMDRLRTIILNILLFHNCRRSLQCFRLKTDREFKWAAPFIIISVHRCRWMGVQDQCISTMSLKCAMVFMEQEHCTVITSLLLWLMNLKVESKMWVTLAHSYWFWFKWDNTISGLQKYYIKQTLPSCNESCWIKLIISHFLSYTPGCNFGMILIWFKAVLSHPL